MHINEFAKQNLMLNIQLLWNESLDAFYDFWEKYFCFDDECN